MRARQPLLLLHPLFLISLALLIVNDFYLKYEFHNWLTGKLSDFAGLFACSVFLASILPPQRRNVLLLLTLFFLWWKSPLSSSFILFLNDVINFPVGRVVDYSDYAAIIMIPLACYLQPATYPAGLLRTIAVCLVSVISLFSFTATSMVRHLTDNNRVTVNEYVRTNKGEDEIVDRLETAGLHPEKIAGIYEREWNRELYVKAKDQLSDTLFTPLEKIYPAVYRKVNLGTTYNIPVMYINNDSVFNLQLVISNTVTPKREVWLHSFEYRVKADTTSPGVPGFYSHQVSRKLSKPLKKKIKRIIKGRKD